MPELPEVEVTRLGVQPHLEGQTVGKVVLRREGLRWPFPADLPRLLAGRTIRTAGRRGKYLLLHFDHGTLIVHLGMTGHVRILPPGVPPQKHDHVDIEVSGGAGPQVMRLTDARRFGAVLWHHASDGALEEHLLLRGLGVEPLEDGFTAALLHRESRK
ncbi:MAG TPA: DNA-formamidopyrimidine glycosylase family protein, partial [Burkholderiaceae bacterium]